MLRCVEEVANTRALAAGVVRSWWAWGNNCSTRPFSWLWACKESLNALFSYLTVSQCEEIAGCFAGSLKLFRRLSWMLRSSSNVMVFTSLPVFYFKMVSSSLACIASKRLPHNSSCRFGRACFRRSIPVACIMSKHGRGSVLETFGFGHNSEKALTENLVAGKAVIGSFSVAHSDFTLRGAGMLLFRRFRDVDPVCHVVALQDLMRPCR